MAAATGEAQKKNQDNDVDNSEASSTNVELKDEEDKEATQGETSA